MESLEKTIENISPASEEAKNGARGHWNSVAKPLHSLGLLEEAIIDIAGIMGTPDVKCDKKAVIVMCADNGVVDEGVTQTSKEVTAVVTENMSRGDSSVCNMGKVAGADIFPVDIGVYRPVKGERIIDKCIRRGTDNMTKGPAMTKKEALRAIEVGIEQVGKLKEEGYSLFATGEMGIGNTTTSSAIVSVLLEAEPETVTGKGAGLSSEGLERKINAIKKAIEVNKPDKNDGLDVLSKVGGFDIAGMVGVFIGGAIYHVPVLIDGFISGAAALVAKAIAPQCVDYMIATHVSKEPAGRMVLSALGKTPFIEAQMCLGEGTGAVAAMPLIDMALMVYHNMSTFSDVNIEAYKPL